MVCVCVCVCVYVCVLFLYDRLKCSVLSFSKEPSVIYYSVRFSVHVIHSQTSVLDYWMRDRNHRSLGSPPQLSSQSIQSPPIFPRTKRGKGGACKRVRDREGNRQKQWS